MTKYLLRTSEMYRFESEKQVEEFIAQEKEGAFNYTVIKYNVTKKERKQKGEIIDTWYRVEIIKEFNDEREPASTVEVRYEG